MLNAELLSPSVWREDAFRDEIDVDRAVILLSLYEALSGDIYCDDNVAVEIVADTVVEDGVVAILDTDVEVDGIDNNDDAGICVVDEEDDDKYSTTEHYWKTGHLGTIYQTFIDVNKIIDSSNLQEKLKKR